MYWSWTFMVLGASFLDPSLEPSGLGLRISGLDYNTCLYSDISPTLWTPSPSLHGLWLPIFWSTMW